MAGRKLTFIATLFIFGCCPLSEVWSLSSDSNAGFETPAASAGKDRFRLILSNVSSVKTQEQIADFLSYGCEAMVVIKNDGEDKARLKCASRDEAPKEARLSPGSSYIFTMKPLANGSSDFWCTLSYRHLWARFDVYTESHPYICAGRKLYEYSVRQDGLYADPNRDGGVKIRALLKGHNKYTMWEHYDEVEDMPDGLLTLGFVDGGMCSDMPDHFDDRTTVVTVCDHQCVFVFDHRRCRGPSQKLQASGGCTNFNLQEHVKQKVSAIKGC